MMMLYDVILMMLKSIISILCGAVGFMFLGTMASSPPKVGAHGWPVQPWFSKPQCHSFVFGLFNQLIRKGMFNQISNLVGRIQDS